LSKVNEKLCPGCNVPESNVPSSAVAVWGAWSLLTHVTVVPAATVALGGLKAKFLMLTVVVLPCAPAVGAKSRRATNERAAKRSIVFLMGVLSPYLWSL